MYYYNIKKTFWLQIKKTIRKSKITGKVATLRLLSPNGLGVSTTVLLWPQSGHFNSDFYLS